MNAKFVNGCDNHVGPNSKPFAGAHRISALVLIFTIARRRALNQQHFVKRMIVERQAVMFF